MARDPRQAVVLIHGIGDQRPMGSLRAFLDNIGFGAYWSKPDRLSDSYELRRFSLPSTRHRPPTDFFELYWAHHFDDGELRQTLLWAARLAFRRPFWRLNRTLRPVIGAVQLLTVVLVVLLLWLVIRALSSGELATLWQSWQAYAAVAVAVVNTVLGGFVRTSVADAARYLTPRPANVAARNAIRRDGVTLLRKLQECGDYQRVIVVGHSLGSVIGYDLLRCAWDELRTPDVRCSGPQPEAKAFDAAAAALGDDPTPACREQFQRAQLRLWRENRERGVPWLVTDFITLGSPLAHGDLLLTDRAVNLQRRQREREFPTCPPVADPREGTSMYLGHLSAGGRTRSFRIGHHGAPFGPTRWTNLYVPASLFLLGDLVGGPVAPVFGPGVRDVPVRQAPGGRWSVLRRVFPFPHSDYWRAGSQPDGAARARTTATRRRRDEVTGTKEAALALRAALALDTRRARRPLPPPGLPVPSAPPPVTASAAPSVAATSTTPPAPAGQPDGAAAPMATAPPAAAALSGEPAPRNGAPTPPATDDPVT